MPNKLKSAKQFRFLEGIANGMQTDKGPSKKIAKRMLDHESHEKKSRLAKRK